MEETSQPPQFGFVIDHRKCIGCHACTVACKSENQVPIGQFRTWVKYTEKGTYPDVRRHFTVLRWHGRAGRGACGTVVRCRPRGRRRSPSHRVPGWT